MAREEEEELFHSGHHEHSAEVSQTSTFPPWLWGAAAAVLSPSSCASCPSQTAQPSGHHQRSGTLSPDQVQLSPDSRTFFFTPLKEYLNITAQKQTCLTLSFQVPDTQEGVISTLKKHCYNLLPLIIKEANTPVSFGAVSEPNNQISQAEQQSASKVLSPSL